MRKPDAQVQNPDGSHNSWKCVAECERLVKQKVLHRVSRLKDPKPRYRFLQYPNPSNSNLSPAVLTLSDMDALVGGRRASVTKIERLIGFGLLSPNTRLVPHYL